MDALAKETVQTQDEALTDLYRKIRPADTPTPEAGKNLLDSFYFNTKRYDLARVGRYKINRKLGLEKDVNDRSLSREDIIATIKYLVTLHAGETKFPGKRDGKDVDLRVDVDDIDHFGNRRIRQVGELIQNQLRTGLSRMERVVRERMTTQDPEAITPQSLINIRPVNATIKEFFGTSQLSQFMDQNNPLAGVTNKRRLSALGPGGLSRDRASMEVRDVHPSHFGRMCPIESPEAEHRSDRLPGNLRTHQPVRFHRDPVPQGRQRPRHRRSRVHDRRPRCRARHRPGQPGARRERQLRQEAGPCPSRRRGSGRCAGQLRRLHGRLPASDGFRRRLPDSVPGAR